MNNIGLQLSGTTHDLCDVCCKPDGLMLPLGRVDVIILLPALFGVENALGGSAYLRCYVCDVSS